MKSSVSEISQGHVGRFVSSALFRLAAVLALLSLQSHVQAQQEHVDILKNAEYSVYSADYNGDSHIDLLLSAKARFTFIAAEIIIPIKLRPVSPTFLLLSDSDGTYSMTVDPGSSVERADIWQPGQHELVFGDVLGNGTVELLIRPYGSHAPAFLVAAPLDTGIPVLLQVISQDEFQVDFGASQTTVELEDINADGRSDLVIRDALGIVDAFVADENGMFISGDEEEFTLAAIWGDFGQHLERGEISQAVSLMSPRVSAEYFDTLTALGPEAAGLPDSWSELRPHFIDENIAEFTFIQTLGGVRRLHRVIFVRDTEGDRWLIEGF